MLRVAFTGLAFIFISLRDQFEDAITGFTEGALGIGDGFTEVIIFTFVMALAFGLLSGFIRLGPSRWTYKHTQTIPAAPAAVWDALYPRTRTDVFERVFQRIDKSRDEEGLYYYTRRRESGAEEMDPIAVYVVEAERGEALHLETHAPDDLLDQYHYESDLFYLEATDGGTRVSATVILHKPSVHFMFCCILANPAKSTLSQLSDFTRRAPKTRNRGALFGRHA